MIMNATPDTLRSWARSQGIAVGDRGRIPGHIVSAYAASVHSGLTDGSVPVTTAIPTPTPTVHTRPRGHGRYVRADTLTDRHVHVHATNDRERVVCDVDRRDGRVYATLLGDDDLTVRLTFNADDIVRVV